MKGNFERIEDECLCFNTARLHRIINKYYNKKFIPLGFDISVSQFHMLLSFQGKKGATITDSSRLLCMDRTTVSRNCKVLIRKGYLIRSDSKDNRDKNYAITKEGIECIDYIYPEWVRINKGLDYGITNYINEAASQIGSLE